MIKWIFINKQGRTYTWDGRHHCNKVIDPATCCPVGCGQEDGWNRDVPESKCTCILGWWERVAKLSGQWAILYQTDSIEMDELLHKLRTQPGFKKEFLLHAADHAYYTHQRHFGFTQLGAHMTNETDRIFLYAAKEP
jgi:hypothetical protein